MKFILSLSILFSISSVFACEKEFSEEVLEKMYKEKIQEEIARYARYSDHTLESIIKKSEKVRLARMIRFERKCRSFEFSVLLSSTCKAEVTLNTIESCQR